MLAWANDFHSIFLVAVIPAFLAVALLFFGVQEPERPQIAGARRVNPIRMTNLLPRGTQTSNRSPRHSPRCGPGRFCARRVS